MSAMSGHASMSPYARCAAIQTLKLLKGLIGNDKNMRNVRKNIRRQTAKVLQFSVQLEGKAGKKSEKNQIRAKSNSLLEL